ncbi:MAG: hypothetical protein ACYTEQ_05365 [Planctomycetota bacterium]
MKNVSVWARKILEDNRDKLQAFIASGNLPSIEMKDGQYEEAWCVREEGCLYETSHPGIQVVVGRMSKTWIDMVEWLLEITKGKWTPGLPYVYGFIRGTEPARTRGTRLKLHRRASELEVVVFWQEAIAAESLHPLIHVCGPTSYNREACKEVAMFELFNLLSGAAAKTLKKGKVKHRLIDASQWDVKPIEVTAEHIDRHGTMGVPVIARVQAMQSQEDALGYILASCKVLSREMQKNKNMEWIGETLGLFLENGILVHDISSEDMGIALRKGNKGRVMLGAFELTQFPQALLGD